MPLNREQQIIADQIKGLLEIIPVISNLERQLLDNPTNLQFMANTTFLTRKCNDVLDAVGKRLQQLEDSVAKQAVVTLAAAQMPNYKGEMCTISNNSGFYVKYPSSPKEEGYYEFIQKLSPDCVRPHYPTVGEVVTKALENGQQVPFGLTGQIVSHPKLRMTSRKEL